MVRLRIVILLGVVITVGVLVGRHWFTTARYIQETDNAYVRSETTQISAKVTGYVKEVLVEDNAVVAAGTPLVRVEDVECRARLERGRGKMDERRAAREGAASRSRLQVSRIEACRAQIVSAEAEQVKRASELRRMASLVPNGIISELDYETVATAAQKAGAEAVVARANLRMAERELDVLQVEERRIGAELRQQEEELKLLSQEVADTVIRAPVAGVVGNRRVRVGQYVKPGTFLLSVIPRQRLWVEANFKEVQLARMREGQRVSVEVDAFAGRPLRATIESLAPASGAEFSLLPPENATGNFTKIVQRVPVKIVFEPGQPLVEELRSGMSAVVRAETKSIPPTLVRRQSAR